MKNMKKFATILMAVVMVLSMATGALAQEVNADTGKASITIENASKGETYKVVKLFDASVTGKEDGSIIYTGTIPNELSAYFVKDSATGSITATDDAKEGTSDNLSPAAVSAITTWALTQNATLTAESDGTTLKFTGLEYGYYVITTTQGTVITVTSTNPNATVRDKNTTDVSVVKKVNDPDVSIGDTVTYTVTFNSANWLVDSSKVSHKVVKYEISDTLPEFLKYVEITSITVGGVALNSTPQFVDKKITIDWVDKNGDHLYDNKAAIVLTYTATVTDPIVVDGNGNTNTVTVKPYVDDPDSDNDKPWNEEYKDSETIFTYAAALFKVDENKAPLAGATFAAKGLEVKPASNNSDGNYIVVSYDPTSNDYGTTMKTDSEGKLFISGLASDSVLTVEEIAAPAGYNKLVNTVELKPVKTGSVVTVTSTITYYDADGNVTETETTSYETKNEYPDAINNLAIKVVNQKGSILPETGGIGTTLFYAIGGGLVLAAAVLLVTKKRMGAAE